MFDDRADTFLENLHGPTPDDPFADESACHAAVSAAEAVADGFTTGIWYVLLVVLLGGLYFAQQRMVAARASISPTMSAGQQKLMQYLPVFFAVFQIFFLAGNAGPHAGLCAGGD